MWQIFYHFVERISQIISMGIERALNQKVNTFKYLSFTSQGDMKIFFLSWIFSRSILFSRFVPFTKETHADKWEQKISLNTTFTEFHLELLIINRYCNFDIDKGIFMTCWSIFVFSSLTSPPSHLRHFPLF